MGCVTPDCYGTRVATPGSGFASRETLLLLHGSAGSGAMWRHAAAALKPLYRVLAPDLIGYGASLEWPPNVPFDPEAERVALEPLLSCCAENFHLVGYSYGGVAALALALAHPQRVRTLTLIEPVFFNALRYAGQWRALFQLMRIRDQFERSLDHGGAEAALPPFIDFWTGQGAWDKLAPPLQAEMLRCASKIALDWRAAFAFAPDRNDLAALGPRTVLLRGDQSPSPMVRLVDCLHALMPGSTLNVFAGANHLLPLARAQDVTEAILRHLHVDAERRLRCAS
jgi:pimeloyl-ACP methyl ester carboxylesterase